MDQRGRHTLSEILSQPAVWSDALAQVEAQADALATFWREGGFEQILFTGCGSTYYLSQFAATLTQQLTGVPCRAYPGSELALFPATGFIPTGKTLLVAVSRSGETSETIAAVKVFKDHLPGKSLAVTCYSESTLAELSDVAVAIDSAREESIAQTRSFSSMALALQAMAALFAGQSQDLTALPALAERLLREYGPLAKTLGQADYLDRFFFLGSDALYSLACEAMLKMKEMSLSYSEAYHTLEFRHGPMSMVDARTLVVGLVSTQAYQQEVAVLRDMQARGARILALVEQAGDGSAVFEHVIPLQTGLPAWVRAVLYLPVLQLLAFYRAIHKDQDPDHAGNLNAVVVLDSLSA